MELRKTVWMQIPYFMLFFFCFFFFSIAFHLGSLSDIHPTNLKTYVSHRLFHAASVELHYRLRKLHLECDIRVDLENCRFKQTSPDTDGLMQVGGIHEASCL